MNDEKTLKVIESDVLPVLKRIEANTRLFVKTSDIVVSANLAKENNALRNESAAQQAYNSADIVDLLESVNKKLPATAAEKKISESKIAEKPNKEGDKKTIIVSEKKTTQKDKAEGSSVKTSEKNAEQKQLKPKSDKQEIKEKPNKEITPKEKPQSAEALKEQREKRKKNDEEKTGGILAAVKNGLASISGIRDTDAEDIAGTTAGGAFYGAYKEISKVVSDFSEKEDGIVGFLKKSAKKKDPRRNSKGQFVQTEKTAKKQEKATRNLTKEVQKETKIEKNKESEVAGSALAMKDGQEEETQEKQLETLEKIVDAIEAGNKKKQVAVAGGEEQGVIGSIISEAIGNKLGKGFGNTKAGKWLGRTKAGKWLGKSKVGGLFGKVLGGGADDAVGAVAKTGILGKMAGSAGLLLKGGGKVLGKVAGPLAAAAIAIPGLFGALKSGDAKEIGGATGGLAGSLGGAAGGAMAGAAIGSVVPVIGTAIGGIAGSIIGAFGGDILGGMAGEKLGEAVSKLTDSIDENNKKLDKEKAGGVQWVGGGVTDWVKEKARKVKRAITGETVEPIKGTEELGSLSARYESGNKGSDAVGWDSTGGTSYGKYQIATKTGTMKRFMEFAKENNPELYERLKAAGPADAGKDGAFAQEWKKAAADGVMGSTEHDFIKATHFDPAYENIDSKELRDKVSQSKSLQDVLWSTAVQHGASGASGIMNKVYQDGMSEEDLIKAVYEERGTRFGRSSANVQASVKNRFASEQAQSLASLEAERANSTIAQTSVNQTRTAEAQAAPAVTAETKRPQIEEPVSIRKEVAKEIPQTQKSGITEKDIQVIMAGMNAGKQSSEKKIAQADTPTIPTEFDDTTLTLMAYDRL